MVVVTVRTDTFRSEDSDTEFTVEDLPTEDSDTELTMEDSPTEDSDTELSSSESSNDINVDLEELHESFDYSDSSEASTVLLCAVIREPLTAQRRV